jgi:hypothetical protein
MKLSIKDSAALIVLALGIATQGCAVESSSDEVDPSEQDVQSASNLKATLVTTALQKTDRKCKVDYSFAQVSGVSVGATAAINKALARSVSGLLQGANCATEAYEVGGSMTASYNGKGILSIEDAVIGFAERAAHPAPTQTMLTFDLRTGQKLLISDVLLPEGIAKLEAACRNDWQAQGATDPCKITSNASFNIEQDGIRYTQPDATYGDVSIGFDGQRVAWKDLRGMIKHPLVRAIAR